jgi:hypothetical protein
MKSEPTVIIEAIRAILILLAAFGFVITQDQQLAIIGAATALFLLASWALAWWNRQSVYAQDTVQRIASRSASTGVPMVGPPPEGTPRGDSSGG